MQRTPTKDIDRRVTRSMMRSGSDEGTEVTNTWSNPSGASALPHSSTTTSSLPDRVAYNAAMQHLGNGPELGYEKINSVPLSANVRLSDPHHVILETRSNASRQSVNSERRRLEATLELQRCVLERTREAEALARTQLELVRLESNEDSEAETILPSFPVVHRSIQVEQWVHRQTDQADRTSETPLDTEVPRGERGTLADQVDSQFDHVRKRLQFEKDLPNYKSQRVGHNKTDSIQDDYIERQTPRSHFTGPNSVHSERRPHHDTYRSTEHRETPSVNLSDMDRLEILAQSLAKAFKGSKPKEDRNAASSKFLHELPFYDGDVSEWVGFSAVYKDTEGLFTDVQNIARLRKALRGQAREAVRALIHTAFSPEQIMQVLERRFGRPEHIVLAELDKIKRMPKLAEDGHNVSEFASRVCNTVSIINSVDQKRYLNSPELIKQIEDKLSLVMRFGWFSFLRDHNLQPDLQVMAEYLNDLAERFSAMTPPGTHDKHKRQEKPRDKDRSKRFTSRRLVNTATKYRCDRDSSQSDDESSDSTYKPRRTVASAKGSMCPPTYSDSENESRAYRSQARSARTHASIRNSDESDDVHSDTDSEYERFKVFATVAAKGINCWLCKKDHHLKDCELFKKKTTAERWEAARESRNCFRCLSGTHRRETCRAKSCGKNNCKKQHHKMLHYSNEAEQNTASRTKNLNPATKSATPRSTSTDSKIKQGQVASVNALSHERHAYLKIIPVELYGPKGKLDTYALLDEGSTMTLIEQETALAIAPRGKSEELRIEGVGGKKIDESDSYKLSIKIKGLYSRDLETMQAQTISKLNLPPQEISSDLVSQCTHLQDIQDEIAYTCAKPTLLIGQDNWHLIVSRELKTGKNTQPVASLTKLGWVLHGYTSALIKPVAFVNYVTPASKPSSIDDLIRDHFSLDSLGIQPKRPQKDPELQALKILDETTKQLPSGQFETGLLWKPENLTMPESRRQAERRLYSIERKLERNPESKEEYHKQMKNLFEKGYAEPAPEISESKRVWYLPHFTVIHPQKKKERLVFDAAARSNGTSLNDALLSGPDLLQSLFGVLVRFREGPVAVISDIKEMFLRIRIREEDRDSLRFLWRESQSTPLIEYRMTSLIFGATSSPCSAIYVKNRNALDHAHLYPEAARAIERQFYVDDFLMAFPDEKSAKKMVKEVDSIHKSAKMELRNWASNKPDVIKSVGSSVSCTQDALLGNKDQWERTLGLIWKINKDSLSFALNLRNTPIEATDGRRAPTKREVSSAVMSVFDPLGLASPITIQGKAIIQEIWRTGIDWDEHVSTEVEKLWKVWLTHVRNLQSLEVPRYVPFSSNQGESELHIFTDASERAYAAAVYLRSQLSDGTVSVNLLAAKAKVTPIKPVSIPRLELQAAVLGCRLATTVRQEMNTKVKSQIFWSDSRTVLAWIKADPRTFKPFVAHRLAEIEESTRPTEWRWVPTKDNVADDATRNVPTTFNAEHRWYKGPEFLTLDPTFWPIENKLGTPFSTTTGEEKTNHTCTLRERTSSSLPDPTRFSSWTRLLRTTARVLQAIHKFKVLAHSNKTQATLMMKKLVKKPKKANEVRPTSNPIQMAHTLLEYEHIEKAEQLLVKLIQQESFSAEINKLKKNEPIERNSRLRKLCMKIDSNGILRIEGRLEAAPNISYTYKQPAVIDANHYITRLIIHHIHREFNHGNHETVMNEIRQRYYVLALRRTVRKLVHTCPWCLVYRKTPQMAPQGNLPKERLAHNQPAFTCSGVDYFGPMTVTIGRRHEKRWGALFTCLTTRAVHLELAASLTTSSMIMALRRFIARRGKPTVLYSDNGTNFVGADRELAIIWNECNEGLKRDVENRQIQWKFIPPGAPNMGGSWERLVKSIKVALAATLKERSPREEVLHTLLLEAEHTVNSRPLTPVSLEDNEEALTPNHFLIGRSCGNTMFGSFNNDDIGNESTWRASQRLADHFWTRWTREYLPTLLPRQNNKSQRYQSPALGDIVLIVDPTMPRNIWPRGEVVKILPGQDGRVRVAEVRTNAGIVRRPASRLVIISNVSGSLCLD